MDSSSRSGSPANRRIIRLAAVLAILAAATAIRIRGALNDLWLDEIWSLNLVAKISSPWQVFTRLHHENNHYLNSLWLYCAGPHGNWPGYRVPSVLAGAGSVVMAWFIGRRRNTAMAFFAMLLTGFSYVLVLYSSEARGYSTAVFFSLLSYHLLDLYLENRRWWLALMFSLVAILALLSQLISAGFVLAALVWSVHRFIRLRLTPRSIVLGLIPCFAPLAGFLAGLYYVDIRQVVSGQGTPAAMIPTYESALSWALGMPPVHSLPILCLAAIVVLGAGIWLLCRAKSDSWSFFLGVILVFPVLLIVLRAGPWIYVRHFVIGIAFFLILFSYVLSSLWQAGIAGRSASVALLSAYLAFNGWHIRTLFQHGRGQYAAALRFMAENTKGPILTMGGDNDFRVGATVEFYALNTQLSRPVNYCIQTAWPPEGPEWVIFQKESIEDPVAPATRFADQRGNHYDLVKTFPTAPLSGLHWFIYHNSAR